MSPGLFLLAMVCGLAGAALLVYFVSPRAMEQAGIRRGGAMQGAGLAVAGVLTAAGLYLIFTQAF